MTHYDGDEGMAAVYETELKQDAKGVWYRWVGEGDKGTKQNFRLGKDKAEAKRRLRLILALYETQVQTAEWYKGTWLPELLQAAKLIAKGRKAKLPRVSLPLDEATSVLQPAEYYAKVLALLNREGEVFEPESSEVFAEGLESINSEQKRHRLIRAKLDGANPDRDPTGQTIGQALDAFMDHLQTQNTLPDGSLSPWGKTQIDQVKTWKRFMSVASETRDGKNVHLKLMLTDLADVTVAKAQQMVDATRNRPMTFESKQKRRMAPKTAGSINKKIKHFFDWLDLSDEWQWWEPARFRKVNYKVAELTPDEKHERKLKREKWRLSDEEKQTLIKYATPVERVLILLGLNCAFGAGEIGSLRIPYVKFDTSEIDGIRFKTGSDTRHHLWLETIEALKWELQRRERLPKTDKSKDIFFLSENGGDPLWKKSKAGNYNNGVAKRWNDLMNRVRKDHPDFHRYSFGKLRKTAAIRMIELADAESASMILAHGIPSDDKILSAYVNIPWQKLYAAQKAYGDTVRPLLKTDHPPFQVPAKNYIGLAKAERILQEYKDGMPVQQIAELVGVSNMTVYRHLDRAGLRTDEEKSSEPAEQDGNQREPSRSI
jgi:integrase/DNA-binding CsgD family transcriptional regulator